MRTRWLAAVVCLGAACASAPTIRKADVAFLASADANVLRGCYDCLIEARDAYARVAAGRARPLVIQRLFETELLIALREHEFALDPTAAIARARALVAEMPPPVDAARYLAMVENVPPEHGGWPRAELAAFRRAHTAFEATVDGELAWLADGPLAPAVRTYLAFALDCGYANRKRAAAASPRDTPAPRAAPAALGPPLLVYRAADCTGGDAVAFTNVRAAVPEFVETSYFLGGSAVRALAAGGGADPRPLVTEVQTRFPASVVVTLLAAKLQQTIGRCDLALPFYDEAIRSRPDHEDAWLGRTTCFTSLARHRDAIDAATHMVEGKFDNVEDALYWRAWNHHALKELAAARADIDAVRRIHVTALILTLAGIIEHDQDDLGPAEADLKLAQRMSVNNCVANWYLGSVFVKRERWPDAAATFDATSACYGSEARNREGDIAALEARRSIDEEYKASQLTAMRGQLDSDRRQQRASALNAGRFYASLGDFASADRLLDVAATEPALVADVDELRRWMAARQSRAAAAP